MTEVEPVLDFASSGRTGRRNALPDILGSPAGVSPSDLPLKLAEMSLSSALTQLEWWGLELAGFSLVLCSKNILCSLEQGSRGTSKGE
uniref:cAMP-dependent protein kinase inhibitor beta n=1 Tax=Terrapene triunguis TaxID=2587831 RepID=A0A674I9N0_9SAUR